MKLEPLQKWNPWWNSKEVPPKLKGSPRAINPLIFKALSEREIVVLTGIRRCGKTTIMYQMISSLLEKHKPEQIFYINLEDEILRKETLESIYSFYRQEKNPETEAFIFLDEIQNVPGWEKFLKKYYDLQEKVKFVVSGSSAHLLQGEYSTLLTGRNFTFKITPLSFKEFLDFSLDKPASLDKAKIIYELNRYLEEGGFPEVYFKEKEIKLLLLKQYFDDIIYKDIVKRYNLNAQKITDLAVYFLTNIGNMFTARKIHNFTGLSLDSIKDYLSYLEDAYLVTTVNHFSYSLKEASQLPRKSYAGDGGLRNIVGYRFSQDGGRLAENCVCAELKKRGKEIYYWKEKGEVDFVVKEKNKLVGINVSYTDEINDREVKGLLEFRKKFKKAEELLILTRDYTAKKEGIVFMPLWKWLIE